MFDMMNMMGKVKELQAKVKEAQQQLQTIEVTEESGAGLVKATANGMKQVISVEVDDSLLNSADKDVVQDLIVAAVNKALDQADILAKEHMQESTQGIMPNIPGFDLGNLFNG